MKKTSLYCWIKSFYWRRCIICGDEVRQEAHYINATVTATASGFAVDLCESWNPEATQGMEPDELAAVRLRAIMDAYGQKWLPTSPYFDWEVEVKPTPTHSDPDDEAIASALAGLRADM